MAQADVRRGRAAARRAAALLAAVALIPASAAARGKFDRRREARGEMTATDPKLSTYGFVNDREASPWGLTLFVDAFPAREPVRDDLLTLGVGVARTEAGPPLPVRADLFTLRFVGSGPGAEAAGLTSENLLRERGLAAAAAVAVRRAALSPAGLPVRLVHGTRLAARFTAPLPGSPPPIDEVELVGGTWLFDLVHFRLPPGAPDRRDTLLELALRSEASAEPLVTVRFRVESDPRRQREAFRRARRALEEAERRERRSERRGDRRKRQR